MPQAAASKQPPLRCAAPCAMLVSACGTLCQRWPWPVLQRRQRVRLGHQSTQGLQGVIVTQYLNYAAWNTGRQTHMPLCTRLGPVMNAWEEELLLHMQRLLLWALHEARQRAGQFSASVARPVSLASVDLSRTIAGGNLLRPDSLPPSPGPFGSLSGAAPAFGAPSRAFSGSPGEVSWAHD